MKEAAFMAHYAVVYEDTIYHVWTPCPGEPRANSMWASLVAQTVRNLPAMQKTWVRSLGREDSAGGGHGYPLQYSCLENPMDKGARSQSHD